MEVSFARCFFLQNKTNRIANRANRTRTIGMLNSGTEDGVAVGSGDEGALAVAEGEAEKVEADEGVGPGVGFGVVVDKLNMG